MDLKDKSSDVQKIYKMFEYCNWEEINNGLDDTRFVTPLKLQLKKQPKINTKWNKQ